MLRSRLLARVPKAALASIQSSMDVVPLAFRQSLYEKNTPIEFVYFPLAGVASIMQHGGNGAVVEIATIGREGVVGVPVLLGAKQTPGEAFVQIPGEAARIRADRLRAAIDKNGDLRNILLRYVHALLQQIAQSAACNRLHSIEERCARWLLMTHDRVDGDDFPLTQEFLAQMLGVRRPTVSVVAGLLQQAGLIRYVRGRMTIVDRAGLEAASCECYGLIRLEFDRLFA